MERLYGLPAYRSQWLRDDEVVVMGERPYQKLTGSELARILGDQISRPAPLDASVFERALTSSTSNVETVFRVGADGRPEAVTRLVATPSKESVRNAGETEIAWLRRRVNEICNWRI